MKDTGTLTVSLPGDREIMMTRVFDAPRRLVFAALTRPELLRHWFDGPPGWSLTVCEFEPRVGGAYRYEWRRDDGTQMGVGGVLREFVPPERMVTSEKFDQPWYPGEAVGTLVLAEHGARTTLTLTVRYESKEARDMVLRTPMKKGVQHGYDVLAAWMAAEGLRWLRHEGKDA